MTVGERIKEIRNKLNMSQVDFADKINVSKQTLYKYENNIITNIPSDKIEAAAKLGNISPAYLMGWKELEFDDKYNMVSSSDSIKISDFADYLLLSERNSLDSNDKKKYIPFIIAGLVEELNESGKYEALKRIKELQYIPQYTEPLKSSDDNIVSYQSHVMPNAAHERTTPYTAEERQDDDNMLD